MTTQYSLVNYSDVSRQPDMRIDADYYSPIFLKIETKLDSLNSKEFDFFIESITDGKHGGVTFTKKGIRFLRNTNVKEFIIDDREILYISESESNETKRAEVSPGNILYTSIGTIGETLVVPPFVTRANINQNLVKIVMRKAFSPYYIAAFLNCKYGKNQSMRLGGGNVQGIINYPKIKTIKIFYPKDSGLIDIIEKIYKRAVKFYYDSFIIYQQAEQILLSELNLLNWKPKHRLSFVKNFSDTQSAQRIDAEYLQPMYENITRAVSLSKNHSCLGDLVSIKKCIEPGSEAYQDKGIMFMRVSNLSKFGFKDGNQQHISEDLYIRIKQHQPKQGEILLSKDATPGITYYLKDEPDKMIPSSGILRLKINNETKLYPEYLTLVLNSVIVQKQIERDTGGSIINHWLVDQIKNTIIPILPIAEQKKIAGMVNESFCNREFSQQLLDVAKRGVELAIEENEKQAQEWIGSELKKLNIK